MAKPDGAAIVLRRSLGPAARPNRPCCIVLCAALACVSTATPGPWRCAETLVALSIGIVFCCRTTGSTTFLTSAHRRQHQRRWLRLQPGAANFIAAIPRAVRCVAVFSGYWFGIWLVAVPAGQADAAFALRPLLLVTALRFLRAPRGMGGAAGCR